MGMEPMADAIITNSDQDTDDKYAIIISPESFLVRNILGFQTSQPINEPKSRTQFISTRPFWHLCLPSKGKENVSTTVQQLLKGFCHGLLAYL